MYHCQHIHCDADADEVFEFLCKATQQWRYSALLSVVECTQRSFWPIGFGARAEKLPEVPPDTVGVKRHLMYLEAHVCIPSPSLPRALHLR